MDSTRESMLLTPAKRRKTAASGVQQKADWRVTASQNLSKASSSASSRNGNQNYQHHQSHFGDNQCVQSEKNAFDDATARGAFVAFLQDLLKRKIVGEQLIRDLERNGNKMDKFLKNRLKLSEFQPMLNILVKVCECSSQQNRSVLISRACQPEFLSRFPIMLVECSRMPGQFLEVVASDMVQFFATISSLLPLTAVRFKATAMSCLSSLQGIKSQGIPVPEALMIKFGEVLKDLQELQLKTPSGSNSSVYYHRRKEQVEKMKYVEPPGDFRQIGIYPSREDVLCAEPPFLRPNIVDGPYKDVEQYLDVQFRLLREDFVRPLREGVQDVISRTDSRRCDSLSVRVYRNVKFLKFIREMDSRVKVVTEGVLLCFDSGSGSKKKKQNWEHSKRFLYGGLVCFTCNNFQTILFATIAGRDLKYLEKGQLLVSFCQPYSENIYNSDYIMIESEVFFEPYYQVLKSLQRLNEHTFPMVEYFVKIQQNDNIPAYLQTSYEEDEDDYDEEERYFYDRGMEKRHDEIEISIEDGKGRQRSMLPLDPRTWPSEKDLGLDPSQYQALQAALTKEMVVIQGPPGTGKTFMALKIAKILIENKVQMRRKTPILVVCLTNHALDQFLVGMLKFTEHLVRIGGQSKEEKLDQFNLRNQRFRRNKEHHQLTSLINESYKKLEHVEGTLYGVSNAASKQGFLMDAAVCEINVSPPQFAVWLIGEDLGHLVTEYFHEEKETRFISFAAMKQTAEKMKRRKIEAIQKKTDLSYNTRQTQADREEAAHLELMKALEELQIKLETLVENDEAWLKLKQTEPLLLTSQDRLLLYILSVRGKQSSIEQERISLVTTISDAKNQIEELKNRDQANFLKRVDVIGMTTNGAARLHKMLSTLKCEIVIVEEAAEVMESHIVACVSNSCSHLILIGDHKQLRPNVSVYELGKYYNFDVSLFERMVMNRKGCVTLQVQHRMAPEIAKLIVPTIYEKLENHKSVHSRPNVRGMLKRLYFLSHSYQELQDKENSSRTNEFEANFLISLCKRLIMQGYKPQQITILATYKGQMFMIKKIIKTVASTQSVEGLQDVLVTVVDNYQGEENDIILLSLVRSNQEGRIGFLATENRVCVALSRAKEGLFIVGNMDMLAAENGTWQKIKITLENQDAVGYTLPLRCEVHLDQIVQVASSHDFTKLTPYDGCNKICDERLNCGHNCTSECHLIHFDHTQIKCQAPCQKKCDAGLHVCKLKCYVPCGSNCCVKVEKDLPCGHCSIAECREDPEEVNCMVVVDKLFADCNHSARVACNVQVCPDKCDRQVPCGHSCTLKCHINDDPDHIHYTCKKPCLRTNKQCSTGRHPCYKMCFEDCNICEEKVTKRRSCGHTFKSVLCHDDIEMVDCQKNCRKALACGHFCTKTCKEDCYPCMQLVDKTRACGHVLKVPCGADPELEPCAEKCIKTLKCGHQCSKLCIDDCEPCTVEVDKQRSCGHTTKVGCDVDPDLKLCTEKCTKTQICHHDCTKLCYEDCNPCEFRVAKERSCGHIFDAVMCHEDVETMDCNEKCLKHLKCGHPCKKSCREECNPCLQMVKKKRKCGHALKVYCSESAEEQICNRKCKKTLKCGHECNKSCSEDCKPCKIEVSKMRSCGHRLDPVLCHEDVEAIACTIKCLKPLACGHLCVNSCSEECSTTGECTDMVNKLRNCGHTIIAACNVNPEMTAFCTQPCKKTLDCGHACTKWCKEDCGPCEIKVSKMRSCGHDIKSMPCHKNVETQNCMKRCGKTLKCGHLCTKTCNENCYPCKQLVGKIRTCGHTATIACYAFNEPMQELCLEMCSKILSCGHGCTKLCLKDCAPCITEVKKLRSCGHSVEVPCHRSAEYVICSQKCLKNLKCGHVCTKPCNQVCSPCLTLVDKKIVECGHFLPLPCYDSEKALRRIDCTQMCSLIMKCGHQCKQWCRNHYCCDDALCDEYVTAVGSCSHRIKRQCYENKLGIPVDIRDCTEPCKTKLVCGHTCSGNCATCHQGRFHIQCMQKCNKLQICGHNCKGWCGEYCPPCEEEHILNCGHGYKSLPCHEAANVCQNKSIMSCRHKTGFGFCMEHSHCERRCDKFLHCNHQCFGFCGEPCPPLCWICDRRTLMMTAFSKKIFAYPLDPRFVLINGCGHVFDSESLTRWLQWQDSRMEVRTCPRCQQIIDGQGNFAGNIFQPLIDHRALMQLKKPAPSEAKILLGTVRNLKGFHRFNIELTEEINYLILRPTLMTPKKLAHYQTKIKIISIIDSIMSTPASHGYSCHNGNTEEKIAFLINMLKRRNDIWIQQTTDFSALLKDLLSAVSLAVKAEEAKKSDVAKFFSRMNIFSRPASEQLDAMDHQVSVNYRHHILKDSWRKCIKCKTLNFSSLGAPATCASCKTMLISKPEFTLA